MVGIILNYSIEPLSFLQKQEIQSVLKFANWMKVKLINKGKNHILEFINYEGYPFYEFENDKYHIFIEGRIYNKSKDKIKHDVFAIADEIFQENRSDYEPIKKWIKGVDGDFIVTVYEKKTKQILVFNDFLGRLPIYYSLKKQSIIISRSLKYIVNSTKSKDFSKHGLAQYLLFGHSLSDNTLFSDIKHLRPSSVIQINPNRKSIVVKKLNEIDYSVKEIINGENKSHIEHISNLFVEGCKSRSFGDRPIVLSLSGGLDSRMIAGGLNKSNCKFESATLLDPWKFDDKVGSLEVQVAQEVANFTKTNLTIVDGKLARGQEFIDLLNYKDGTNHVGFSYLLRYLTDVQNRYGSKIIFYTGDGGQVVKLQPPAGKLNSYLDLFNYLLKILQRFSLTNVSMLTGLKESEIQESIIEHLKTYPEQSLKDKYVHFIYNERVNNWLFEGEDRNRHFFWSVTPFYSLDFFLAAIQTPDKLRKRNKLSIGILNTLMPELNNIVYANLKWPINSLKSKAYLFTKDIYNSLPSNYRGAIRTAFRKDSIIKNENNQTINLLKDLVFSNKDFYSEYLNIDKISSYNDFNSDELKMLLNLVSTMEHFSGGNTLENYLDTEFSFR